MREPSVLLVNPWIFDFAAYDSWTKPVGLLSLGAVLIGAGYRVRLLDCMDRFHPALPPSVRGAAGRTRPDGTGHFHKHVLPKPGPLAAVPRRYGRYGLPVETVVSLLADSPDPDFILVTSGMTYWYPGVAEMIGLLKERFRSAPVFLGGLYATLCTDHARRTSGADRVVPGEGERACLDLAAEVTGLKAGPARHGESRGAPADPDAFPFPAYGLVPDLRSAALLTSRGCPFACPFCASPLLNAGFRRLSPGAVAAEIERLFRSRGVRHMAFYDDALLYRKEEHFRPLLRALESLNLPVRFHTPNGLHPAWLDAGTARLMRSTGFETVRLSLETADPARHGEMGGKVTGDDLARAVRLLLEAGFEPDRLGAYAIAGLPRQPFEDSLESLRFVFSLGIRIGLALFSPIPGTASHGDAVRMGLLAPDADPLLSNNSAFLLHSRPDEYRRFVRLQTLAATGNGLVKQGRRPLDDAGFRKALGELEG